MGKSSSPTVGFWYKMGAHVGWCAGPVDAFLEFRGGDRTAWSGEQTTSGPIAIMARNLYGGSKKEGGIEGTLNLMMGEDTQMPDAYLVSELGPQSAYRGLFTSTFRGIVGAMNPYIKAWSGKMRRISKGWRVPMWQPDLARIGDGMNAAHILYMCAVNFRGWDPSDLDLDRMLVAAQTLHDEGMGLCIKWTRTDPMDGFITQVCSHIGGMWVKDTETGKYFLKLLRADYDPATLDELDESVIMEVTEYNQALLAGSVNQITVVYRDVTTNKDASITATNPANLQAQGGAVVPQTNQYPGFGDGNLAARAAVRDVTASSSLLASSTIVIKKPGKAILRGDVKALSLKRFGLSRMPVRVLEVDDGDTTSSKVTLKIAQDQFGMPATSFISIQAPGWVEPSQVPQPVPAQVLFEASYRDISTRLRAADRATLDVDAGFVGTLGSRPTGVAYDYTLMTRIANTGSYAERGSGDFAPVGFLAVDLLPGALTAVLLNFSGLDLVVVGSEAMIGDELVRVDAIDSTTGAVTFARGCVDTVPALVHGANSRVWFTDDYTGVDTTEYATGESVQAQLLTRTGTGELDMALAPVSIVTLNQRQARPYPPGNLRVNGARYPTAVEGALVLAWSHRDRLLQADQLVDTLQGDIGPEPDTTYTVRVYLNGVLDSTSTGDWATTLTPLVSADGTVRVEVQAVRDGLTSWQSLSATFAYTRGQIRLTEDGDNRITEAGDTRITES